MDPSRCPLGHKLKVTLIGKATSGNDDHFCDGCGRRYIQAPEKVHRCGACNYDLCGRCGLPPGGFEEAADRAGAAAEEALGLELNRDFRVLWRHLLVFRDARLILGFRDSDKARRAVQEPALRRLHLAPLQPLHGVTAPLVPAPEALTVEAWPSAVGVAAALHWPEESAEQARAVAEDGPSELCSQDVERPAPRAEQAREVVEASQATEEERLQKLRARWQQVLAAKKAAAEDVSLPEGSRPGGDDKSDAWGRLRVVSPLPQANSGPEHKGAVPDG